MKTLFVMVLGMFGGQGAALLAADTTGPQGKVGCLDQPKLVHRLDDWIEAAVSREASH